MTKFRLIRQRMACGFLTASLLATGFIATTAWAQNEEDDRSRPLEEILVTAQRREQSLQDVPISVEVFSGRELRRQGFRDMDDLANFSPTVLIEPRVQDQDISIRGFGTTGNALTLDQAAPTFVDGIHFGRSSQIKLAFMDVASVEVLKGPQPVYFGQNATAGAFNIRSIRPTDTWEGYLSAEASSFSTADFKFGIGGPLTEKLGIRVAGMHETTEGYLDYVVTGDPYGAYENSGGRVMLDYDFTERLTVTGKVEVSKIRKDSETISLCRTDGPLIFGRGGPLDDPDEPPGDERSVWDTTVNGGSAWGTPFTALPTKCFEDSRGVSQGGPYYLPPQTIREENSNFGSVDIRAAADGFARTAGNNGAAGYEDLDAVNSYIEFAYDFDNGTYLEWITGTSSYERDYVQDNSNSPFLMNFQGRGEDFEQWSTELRLTSGPGRFEWNGGIFFQNTDLSAFSSSLRANVRQSQRYNFITEDVDFAAVFGTLTFNVSDNFAIDVGGRYQDVDKFATVEGYAASWVFDVCPEDPCDLDPAVNTASDLVFDPVLDGYAGDAGSVDGDAYYIVDPTTVRLSEPVAPGTTLYGMPYRETRNVPLAWISGNAFPVGLSAADYAIRVDRGEGPWAERFTESGFSPQVTMRWKATDDISVYARYAEATKIGGFDTGQTSIPGSVDELTFETEDAEQIELGVKGALLDGRLFFDASIFELEFPNLQTTAVSPDPEQTSSSVNAGQRVRGVEWNLNFAVTDRLRLGFAGALMDGEMTDFRNSGCTDSEIFEAVGNADAPCEFFNDGTQFFPTDILDAVDADAAFIDRTGSPAPRTPEWKYVFTADYFMPLGSNYELIFSGKGFMSDGYILDVESFDQVVKYNTHEDLNIIVSLRGVEEPWQLSVFARNILEARPSYNKKFDVIPNGTAAVHLSPASFRQMGVKFEYFFGQ